MNIVRSGSGALWVASIVLIGVVLIGCQRENTSAQHKPSAKTSNKNDIAGIYLTTRSTARHLLLSFQPLSPTFLRFR